MHATDIVPTQSKKELTTWVLPSSTIFSIIREKRRKHINSSRKALYIYTKYIFIYVQIKYSKKYKRLK